METIKKRAVFPVLVSLVMAALASIGSAFAWFNIATNASVETINGQASAAGAGIMLSADNITYTYDIDIADCISLNEPDELLTVSTSGSPTNGLLTFFNAEVTGMDGEHTLITSSDAAKLTIADGTGIMTENADTAGYIAFDIFFQVIGNDSEDGEEKVEIYLNFGSEVVDTTSTSKSVVEAIRVAFLNLGNGTKEEVVALSSSEEGSIVIWEPGTQEDNYYGLIAKSEDEEDEFYAYELVDKSIKVTTKSTDDLVLKANNTVVAQDPIATIQEGFNKIRVYIWLEGNDKDCLNDISLNTLEINLHFFSVAVVPGP